MAMQGHKIINQNGLHYLTLTVVGWLDVFSRQEYRDMILDSLKYCQKEKGLVVNAYVVMSNHLHLIAYAKEGFKLSAILRDFKKFTAKQIIQAITNNPKESRTSWLLTHFIEFGNLNKDNKTFQFWQRGNHPIELESPKWIYQKIDYIHLNPVRNGLVDYPEHYLYSSARDYLGQKGLLNIEVIDIGVSEGYLG